MIRLAPELAALKANTKVLIDACGGSEACSTLLDGKSASLIRSYANPNVLDRFMPLDDVLALERFAGRPIVSAHLVERQATDPDRPRSDLTMEAVARLAQEGAGAKLAVVKALADGKVCAADRRDVARELRELRDLVGELLDAVEGW